jgi:hypothetical protein
MTKGDILARYKPFQPMAVQTIVLRRSQTPAGRPGARLDTRLLTTARQ